MSDPREAVDAQLARAYDKHGREPWGRHEFYAILKEEVDELWDAIKGDEPIEHVLDEAAQIACVCLRYMETGDRYNGPHPRAPALDEPTISTRPEGTTHAYSQSKYGLPGGAYCGVCGLPYADLIHEVSGS